MGVDVVRACLALLPTFLLVVVAALGIVRDAITLSVLLIVCLTATGVLYTAWVPLMADELTNAHIVAAGRARITAQKARPPGG